MGKKIIFFFAWLGIFIISLLGIVYVTVPDFIVKFEIDTFMWNTIIVIVSLLYLVVTILKFFTLFSKEEGYVIKNENGEVKISVDSIKNMIKEVLKKDTDISNIKINCHKRGKKFGITIHLDMDTDRDVPGKTHEIQNIIKNELQNKLQLDLSFVEVKIKKLSLKNSSN